MLDPILSQPVMEGIVALVLVEHEEKRAAQAICSFAEAAHFPASLWISLSNESHALPLIAASGRFSIATLSEKQTALARRYGTPQGGATFDISGLRIEPFADGFWYLKGALATTACDVKETIDLGDRTMFLADIRAARLDSRRSHLRQLLTSEVSGE